MKFRRTIGLGLSFIITISNLSMVLSNDNIEISFSENKQVAEENATPNESIKSTSENQYNSMQDNTIANRNILVDDNIVDSGSCGENLIWYLDTEGTLIISGTGKMYDGDNLWNNNSKNIKTVIMEDGLTSIGEYAFFDCSILTKVTIPNGVISIGYEAFAHCENLQDILIPDTVTELGIFAFYNCGITSAYIPAGITWLGSEDTNNAVFEGCVNLKEFIVNENNSIYSSKNGVLFNKDKTQIIQYPKGKTDSKYYIPKTVINLDNSTFAYSSNLIHIVIPESITSIGSYAFEGCDNLTNITIPKSVVNIESSAFSNCNNLTEVYYEGSQEDWNNINIDNKWNENDTLINSEIHYNSNVTEIASGKCGENVTWILNNDELLTISGTGDMEDYDTFSVPWRGNRNYITKVIVEEGITSISDFAFFDCMNLTDAELPKSLNNMGSGLFQSCSNLKNVKLPDNLRDIGSSTFRYCTSLENITLPSGLISIDGLVFAGCKSLKSIDLPETLTIIDEGSFENCVSLKSIDIPNSVTVIGRYAFSGCKSLENLIISKNVTEIERYAFSGCSKIKNINLPNNLTSIGASAFKKCDSLTNIIIPGSVENIGGSIFQECSNLSEITLEEGTRSSTISFKNCTGLKTIHIPASLTPDFVINTGIDTMWGNAGTAFDGCKNLVNIDIAPENPVYSSYDGVLYNKDKTKLIYYPLGKKSYNILESVSDIGTLAFFHNNLENIVLPNNIVNIGNGSFAYCENLKNITLSDNIKEIDVKAFVKCKNLTHIYNIPKNIVKIDKSAFAYCDSLTDIYYKGSKDEWNNIIADFGEDSLKNVIIHYENDINNNPSDNYIYGDVDGIDDIGVNDASVVLQKVLNNNNKLYIEEKTTDYMKYADVSGDGRLTALDAAMILQKALHSDFVFPVEK